MMRDRRFSKYNHNTSAINVINYILIVDYGVNAPPIEITIK